jgi:hypothetical protein
MSKEPNESKQTQSQFTVNNAQIIKIEKHHISSNPGSRSSSGGGLGRFAVEVGVPWTLL